MYSDTENINFVKIRNLDTIVIALDVVALIEQCTIVYQLSSILHA